MSFPVSLPIIVYFCAEKTHLYAKHEHANDKTCPICRYENAERTVTRLSTEIADQRDENAKLRRTISNLKGQITKLKGTR